MGVSGPISCKGSVGVFLAVSWRLTPLPLSRCALRAMQGEGLGLEVGVRVVATCSARADERVLDMWLACWFVGWEQPLPYATSYTAAKIHGQPGTCAGACVDLTQRTRSPPQWLGFTDDQGLPAVADSEGVIAIR